MTICESTDLQWLKVLDTIGEPLPKAVVVLLRHGGGSRPTAYAPVTYAEEARKRTEKVGQYLKGVIDEKGLQLSSARASDDSHTIETCRALLEGAGSGLTVTPDRLLGSPSIFVTDEEVAADTFDKRGKAFCKEALMRGDRLPGWSTDPRADSKKLLAHLFGCITGENGIGLFVSHDIVIGLVVSLCLGKPMQLQELPGPLEGAVFRLNRDGSIDFSYRDYTGCCP